MRGERFCAPFGLREANHVAVAIFPTVVLCTGPLAVNGTKSQHQEEYGEHSKLVSVHGL